MTAFGNDLRYGARSLAKNPGFTLLAVATLALGIGVNATIFGLVNSLLFSELPIADPDTFGLVQAVSTESNDTESPTTLADFALLKKDTQVFADAAVAVREYFVLTGDGEPARARALRVSDNYFGVWGVSPVLGRGFVDGEDRPGAAPVTVLSHGFWSRRYGEDPSIVGDQILLDGQPHTIVGVQSPRMEFGFLAQIDLWVGLRADPATAPRERTALVSVRIDPEVPFERASEEAAAVATKLARIYPDTHRGWTLRVQSVSEALLDDEDRSLVAILFATVGLVLLIACANVANMMLARATTRSKEVAVRIALGAGRLRLVRQLLVEGFLLSAVAAGLGLLLAGGLLDLLVLMTSGEHVVFGMADIDGQVLAFTLAIAAIAPLVFALVPALRASRPDLGGMLKDGARAGDGRAGLGSRGVLVMAQVGMALMLMVVIGLLVRNLREMRQIDLGFDHERVLSAQLDLPETKYESAAARTQFYDALIERLNATPGIRAAAAVSENPLTGFGARRTLSVEGAAANAETAPTAHFFSCTPGYFTAMRISVVRGRVFENIDTSETERVALINQTAAERYWPRGDALGARFSTDDAGGWTRVVGIVGDVINPDIQNLHVPQIYLPATQAPQARMVVVARSEDEPGTYADALRSHVWELDPSQPVDNVRTFSELHYEEFAENFALVTLFAIFAGFALVMASMGIYGVMSYAVNQRRREISVRMALGASAGDVLRLVVGAGAKLVFVGSAFGLLGALLVNRALASVLFGVSNVDVASFVVVPVVLIAVALTANYVPARRASQIDPMTSLRAD